MLSSYQKKVLRATHLAQKKVLRNTHPTKKVLRNTHPAQKKAMPTIQLT
ncbi:MAG: hypothetical protein BSOLF_2004 [Candidatus Carbobacillus altaicus]|uniref:Uncharacterized protein n=1 Tax=Candidatus Carbonibacillus altaicus TaxID=2163959 RepID=A0A2R6Y3I2_9BACL|nr:MAG: hypothetical protein BSOLF_2004 [Candidatus Carbobacillus altaicus]